MRLLLAAALLACCALAHAQPPASEARAKFELGLKYRNASGTARDSRRALSLIETAAARRHAPAMFTLSNMLAAGEGGPADLVAARRWLEAAAEIEYPEAMQQLAMHLREGAMGYQRDEARAAQLVRKMAHAMKHRHQH